MARPTLSPRSSSHAADVIVHVAVATAAATGCSRSLGAGAPRIQNVLAVSGDHPSRASRACRGRSSTWTRWASSTLPRLVNEGSSDASGGEVRSRLLSRLRRLALQAPRGRGGPPIPQARAQGPGGRRFVTPAGYDARAWDELLRWMRRADLRILAIANVYVLSRTVARLFHGNQIPAASSRTSCSRSPSARPPRPTRAGPSSWSSPRGRSRSARPGFRASTWPATCRRRRGAVPRHRGLLRARRLARVCREVAYSPRGASVFAADPATGLATDALAPRTPAASRPCADRARRRASPGTRQTGSPTAWFRARDRGLPAAGRALRTARGGHLGARSMS